MFSLEWAISNRRQAPFPRNIRSAASNYRCTAPQQGLDVRVTWTLAVHVPDESF
ncbi:hypothetical protein PHLCEN_2v1373 [Hermanssonia centrifuga]|uniref:Uncharacterized protein n=1 Tax=Hermanssonia centrifuga TaxID=98765 RepID=A0A2R6S392_9APHY|nr:hypothetical protein PHLCEN_2v1373 [Hermanssonia centrifuga]